MASRWWWLMTSDSSNDLCPWDAEAGAMEFASDDFDTAAAADLPQGLEHFEVAAQQDEHFEAQYDEWFEYLFWSDNQVALALEQSCHEGALLPWDMRGVRLNGVPAPALSKLHFFWHECPAHVAAHLMVLCYWVVRLERLRRTGWPNWSCRDPVPAQKTERAFFRPSKLVFRRQS